MENNAGGIPPVAYQVPMNFLIPPIKETLETCMAEALANPSRGVVSAAEGFIIYQYEPTDVDKACFPLLEKVSTIWVVTKPGSQS